MKEMTRILFITSGLTHGGVNKSLLSLLKVLDKQQYEIELFSIYQSGPYMEIFSDYNFVSLHNLIPSFLHYDQTKEKNNFTDLYLKTLIHLFPMKYCQKFGYILSSRHYDIVVSFQEGFATYFATFVKASKHIAWIHCDYSRYLKITGKDETTTYQKYDDIVAVSNYTAEIVKKCIPCVANKVMAIHNVMDDQDIILKSYEKTDDKRFVKSKLTLVSIGRISPVKRFVEIPQMTKKIKEAGIAVKWYIIGDGDSEKKELIKQISVNDVENEVILLGEKSNPYSYLVQCDWLVCPSSSEAYPNVVNEARILHTPVITADFPSACEVVDIAKTGFICSIDKIADMIIELYQNKEEYNKLLCETQKFVYDNDSIVCQIQNCFDI